MNRIVLIGNGFDLAHGLPTRYEDFINDYWEGFLMSCAKQDIHNTSGSYKKDSISINITDRDRLLSDFLPSANQFSDIPNKKPIEFTQLRQKIDEYNKGKTVGYEIKLRIENIFLLHLLRDIDKKINKTWIDIENEYYKYLCCQFFNNSNTGKYDAYLGKTINLNDDFQQIKESLNKYLSNLIIKNEVQKSKRIWDIIYSGIYLKDFTTKGQESLASDEFGKIKREMNETWDEFQESISKKARPLLDLYKNYDDQLLKDVILYDLQNEDKAKQYFELNLKSILFLNFNYTNTESHYSNNDDFNSEVIHIHGEINNPNNEIIFGYGDELEENYSKLENLQDNAYLENIKSIQYQETDNYKKMLNFINSDKYQVIILGHSCGNSDRTLLNTLFEHENCVSIKPYYYQYKDEKTGETKDNYSDIVRNISRSFKDKKSMRDKVVNKTYTDWFSSDGKE